MHVMYDHPRGPRENHLFQEVSCASYLRNTLVCYSGERLVMSSIAEASVQKSYPSQRSVICNSCPPQHIPVFYASSKMDPEIPWLERSPNFPAEASCMLIVHITRWKDVWFPCRDPRNSPSPPLHLKNGANMLFTTRKPRGVHCFKFWWCLAIF